MNDQLTIGAAARQAGLTTKTIRFYESEGLLPPPGRSTSGYRVYGEGDLARLQFVQRLRLLGLPLNTIKGLVQTALSDDCSRFSAELIETIAGQRREVERRLSELRLLQDELDRLEAHVNHCCDDCIPAEGASQCGFCGLTSPRKEETTS